MPRGLGLYVAVGGSTSVAVSWSASVLPGIVVSIRCLGIGFSLFTPTVVGTRGSSKSETNAGQMWWACLGGGICVALEGG